MKNVQAHEIGGLALQKKKKIEKNNFDYKYYWYKRWFLLIQNGHFIKSSFTVKLMVGCWLKCYYDAKKTVLYKKGIL